MNSQHSNIFIDSLLILFLFLVINSNYDVIAQRLYTSQEKEALAQFRPLVGDKLTNDIQRKDDYLLRWLLSYEFDIQKAKLALEKSLKWRKDEDMDSILDGVSNDFPKDLPYNFDGVDRGDRPLLLVEFGKWKLRKYVLAGKTKEYSTEFKRMMERALRKIFKSTELIDKHIDEFYFLVDFQGINRKDHMCAACVPLILEMAISVDLNLSAFMKNLTLINVPRYFQPVLQVAKNAAGLQSLKTLNDYDSNSAVWRPAVLNDISPDQLPKSISGK